MLVNKKQDWSSFEEPVRSPKPQPRLNTGLRAECVLMVAVLVMTAAILLFGREYNIRAGYELVTMKMQIAKLEAENELLRLDIAKLRSPQRIQQIAASQGMIVPTSVYAGSIGVKPAEPAKDQGTRTAGISPLMSKAEAGKRQ